MCCHARQDFAEASRQTWINNIQGADYKIFYGRGNHPLKFDEVQLDAPDDYYHLITKIYEIVKWAFAHGYDYILKCDDDVYVLPDRLIASNLRKWDFVGGESFGIDENNRLFRYQGGVLAPGGAWWLSRKAMQAVLSFERPEEGADEPWVASALKQHGIQVHIDARIGCYGNLPYGDYEFVNCYLPKELEVIAEYEFNPAQMIANHQQWKTGTRILPKEKRVDKNKVDMMVAGCHIRNPA